MVIPKKGTKLKCINPICTLEYGKIYTVCGGFVDAGRDIIYVRIKEVTPGLFCLARFDALSGDRKKELSAEV